MAGSDGLPTADTRPFCVLNWVERDGRRVVEGGRETCNADGLRLAFRLAAEGASDRTVARELTAAGYRTTGNRGHNPFHKDTVAEMLTNRFYWGELPLFEEVRDAGGRVAKVQVGWSRGKHAPLEGFDEALWEQLQAVREQNRTRASKTTSPARTYALSGLCTCAACGGPVRVQRGHGGRVRLACRKRMDEPGSCPNAMTYQDVYEEQIGAYLAAFQIPEDLQTRLLDAMRAIAPAVESPDQERRTLEARLERIKELYD